MLDNVAETLASIWPTFHWQSTHDVVTAHVEALYLRAIVKYLHAEDFRVGTIVARERDGRLSATYCFYGGRYHGWVVLTTTVDQQERALPSITPIAIAADWFEREIEDLFSIHFTQHPRLGDFVLHDEQWAENIGLMRPNISATAPMPERPREWRPKRVLEEEGAFVMPVGPVYSGEAESALFLLETVGEDVVRAIPRLFYKYRAIEKLAQGRSIDDVLLLAERCSGTSAIGNALGYCHAIESALNVDVPQRALLLRAFFAELERFRHHMTSIREICASTALTVSESHAIWLEEQLLRITGELTGHRYFFGVLAIGGLMRDYSDAALRTAHDGIVKLWSKISGLRDALAKSSSFLDRIERVGIVSESAARTFELVGPFARASGVSADLRRVQPYGAYQKLNVVVPIEREGDGYARLRVLFAEMEQSLRLTEQICIDLTSGPITTDAPVLARQGLGWAEAPRGASVHWVEIDYNGTLARYRLTPPSFRNWHGFHVATEEFAFQDFPIVLATLDLSVAENDR